MDQFLTPVVIWFVVGLALFLMEMAVPGFLLFFLGVGAWTVTLIMLVFDLPINAQLGVFIIASVLSLVLLRNKLKSIFRGKASNKPGEPGEFDDFSGKTVIVVNDIPSGGAGKVELNGTLWNAESDEDIKEGTKVIITGKRDLTFLVKPVGRTE